MARKVHKLTEKEVINFSLIGIASVENDYRLSWMLNNACGWKLSRQENMVVFHKRLGEKQEFSQFRYHDEESLFLYRLISNRCENGYLLEEMKQIDYLLQVSGGPDKEWIEELNRDLNTLDSIAISFIIDPNSLKSIQRLLL